MYVVGTEVGAVPVWEKDLNLSQWKHVLHNNL